MVSSISCAITGYKMTYLDIPYLEEFMLHLIYFIPLFTSSGFALMGVEEYSFNFVFYSTLSLAVTLFIRYAAEFSYIYAFDWSAFRLKTPSLFLNLLVDFIFIATLLIYAYQELRDPVKRKLESKSNSNIREVGTLRKTTGTPGSGPLSSTPTNSNIHNEFERKTVKNSNLEAAKKPSSPPTQRQGIGIGAHEGEALHYPITPMDKEILKKPLPPLPAGTVDGTKEFDDISLPPHIPLASPDYDDV
ncbi:hypothetical protein Ocin01_08198 [Orchesella cincta]|uniref:Transmembrane protein n=1 Tax=Orchesella cincta TaxID=48709 RepID=A0A1D2N089_ORCCI|nr:hypothetical protein Ocin01_08198 [Orchesella cincta]